jgi:WD40 repeat protein
MTMHNKNTLFQIVLFVLLYAFPTVLLAQAELTQTYTSDDGLFTMSYPEGWTVTEDDGVINFNSGQGFLQASYRDYGEEVTTLEILEISASTAYGFSEPEELDIAGYAAVQARSSDQLETVINFCGGMLGDIIGFVQPGDMATFEPTFMAMMQSIRFGEGDPVFCKGLFDDLVPITPANAAQLSQVMTLGDETVSVASVAFSSDSKLLAAGALDGSVRLWSMVTGEDQGILEGHRGGATSVAFSSGGYLLAVGTGNGQVRLWDVDTGESSGTMQEHSTAVESVAFVTDGFLVASGSLDGEVRLWDVASRAELPPLSDSNDLTPVESVAFSPDGTMLAAGGGNTIRLWDVEAETVKAVLETDIGEIATVSFRPDGALLVYGGADGAVWVWDLADDNHALLAGQADQMMALAFSSDGQMIASGDSGAVRLWDASTGENLVALTSTSGQAVNSVAFRPDGTLVASGGESGGVILWGTSAEGAQATSATAGTGETTATTTTEETTSGASTCTITSPSTANLRSGAGTNFDRAGSLSAGQSAEVNGQTIGADGMTWYQLTDGAWVRSDVVNAPDECAAVPVVTP